MRDGTIAALLYNTHRGKNAAALRWNDFFSNAEAPKASAAEANPEKQSAKVIELFQEFNARFKTKGA